MAGRFSVEAIFKAVDRITAPVSKMQNRVGKFTRSMRNGLRSVNRVLNKTARGLKSAAGTAVKFGAIGIGTIAASVGLLLREFSKIEDAEAAFTPLLGGAKRAKEMVQALNDTAATTPFQFETLASTANQLLPVMNGNIERTIKITRMLGDTAGGNAQKLDSIARGFTKAMLKGKVDMESLNMIGEAGVPIFTELADSMGVKVNKSFFKMISAGKVTTAQLTKAFEKMTSKGGIFFGGMEIASKTTTGLFSTLKDNISLTAAEIGSVLAPTIKDIIKNLTGVAQKVRAWVSSNKDLLNTKFLEFVEMSKRALGSLAQVFEFISDHGSTILKVIAWVTGLIVVMKVLIGVLTLVNLVMALNPLGMMVLGVVALIAAFTALVVWLNDAVRLFDKIGSAASSIGSFFGIGGGDVKSQVVSPQDRVARSIEERRQTSSAEVTIRDDTGRAEVTSGKLGAGLALQSSGAF